jgi:hypothetical protein
MVTGRRGCAAAIVLVLALCALLPASAFGEAGQPIRLGVGANPNVSLESDGTADIAFTGAGANSAQLFFCRLPRGATACSVTTQVAAPGDSLTIPLAFGSGNNISLISYRYGLTNGPFAQVLLFSSGDGGTTFGPGVPIGTVPPYDMAFGPTGLISAVTNAVTAELDYQAWSLTGNTSAVAALDGDPYEYLGSVAMLDPNTPIVVYSSRGGAGRFRRYTGIGDVNDQASWTPATDIGQLDYPHVVTGPSGTFLIAQNDLSGSTMEARPYDGTTFGARTKILDGTRADHAIEDAGGRIHAVGELFSGGPHDASLVYASSDDGAHWLSEDVFYPAVPTHMRIAMGADHFGTVVGTLADDNSVFVANLGPAAAEPTTDKFVDARVVSGTVLIEQPGAKAFTPLRTGDVIPVGSLVDATKGRVRITIALPNGKLQSSDFYSGIFRVTQAKSGLATMVLAGGSFKACGKTAAVRSAKAAKVIRQLWASGSGKFATKGRYASAAIRGTSWDTIDRCDGTLIRVTQGKIAVTNLRTHVTKVVGKGHSLFVSA